MSEPRLSNDEINRFITAYIDTVPQLEGLLMVWRTRPQQWPDAEVARRLFVKTDEVQAILQPLVARGLLRHRNRPEPAYWYESTAREIDCLVQALADTYRRELVRVSTVIHSKQPAAAPEPARGFKLNRHRH